VCDSGRGGNGQTTAEREELNQLRRENRQLKLERDILSKAAAWFARRFKRVIDPAKLSLNLAFSVTGCAVGHLAGRRAYCLGPPRAGRGFAFGYIVPRVGRNSCCLSSYGSDCQNHPTERR
jgi:hypothetical protein